MRTTPNVLYYPSNDEYTQLPTSPDSLSIQPSQDEQILSEVVLTPMPAISEKEETETVPVEKPTQEIQNILMDGVYVGMGFEYRSIHLYMLIL